MRKSRVVTAACVLAGLVLASAGPLPAAGGGGSGNPFGAAKAQRQRVRTQVREAGVCAPANTVVVQPGARQFDSLQKGLDAAAGGGRVYLGPGVYTGNWVLPPGVSVFGAGAEETILIGAVGVSQPTIRFLPPGGSGSYASLEALAIAGREVAAVQYTGTSAAARFELDDCWVQTYTSLAIPAIRMTGSGFGSGQVLELTLEDVRIEAGTGAGLDIDVVDYVTVNLWDLDEVMVATTAVDMNCTSAAPNETRLYFDGGLNGSCQQGIKATNVGKVEAFVIFIDATAEAVVLSQTEAEFRICFIKTPGTAFRALNGSILRIAYTEFADCVQTTDVDGTSTAKMVYCHRDFVPL